MSHIHPLLYGVEAIGERYRMLPERDGLFELIYEQILTNWHRRSEQDRWPTPSNWILRVVPDYTHDSRRHFEKQLQKQIAICLEDEGWGNDVPTASGLIDSGGRQMNVDLAHRVTDGFELVELKLESNTPYDAAIQVLRYGAIYMLYRLEPDLARRFQSHEMIRAKRIVLVVLAPYGYFSQSDVDLPLLERQLNRDVAIFANKHNSAVSLSFHFAALPPEFIYKPGMDCGVIRGAVRHRASPFSEQSEPQGSVPQYGESPMAVAIKGYANQPIRSFADWEKYALPPDRRTRHWKEGRSAFELGRIWTISGKPAAPAVLVQLLKSHEGTKRTVIKSGITEHETFLPFGNRGPRCHDLSLQAERDDSAITICIEAKADEPFGGTVEEELRKARQRPVTRFPERLDWLTRSLLGVPAYTDADHQVLSEVISVLPYQLFAAIAGTLLEAGIRGAITAIFLVHEFRTTATVDAKMEANADALNSFLSLLQSVNGGPDEDRQLQPGEIIGPILIIERPVAGSARLPCQIPLFIGKIRTDRLS